MRPCEVEIDDGRMSATREAARTEQCELAPDERARLRRERLRRRRDEDDAAREAGEPRSPPRPSPPTRRTGRRRRRRGRRSPRVRRRSPTASSAPSCRASSCFSAERVIATTRAPSVFATCTAFEPTPPIPSTATVSPGLHARDLHERVVGRTDRVGQHRERRGVDVRAAAGSASTPGARRTPRMRRRRRRPCGWTFGPRFGRGASAVFSM